MSPTESSRVYNHYPCLLPPPIAPMLTKHKHKKALHRSFRVMYPNTLIELAEHNQHGPDAVGDRRGDGLQFSE